MVTDATCVKMKAVGIWIQLANMAMALKSVVAKIFNTDPLW